MFLEKEYCLLHWFDLRKGPIFDLFHITKMGHYLHKKFLVFLGARSIRCNSNSMLNILDEMVNVFDLFMSVVK